MDDTRIQVRLSVKRDDTNAMVFYKQDGQRFDSDCTVKLKVQTPYKFLISLKPPQIIRCATLNGENLELDAEESSPDSSKLLYKWNSYNVTVTKKNKRLAYNLDLEVENVGFLKLPLQVKFYEANDTTHSAWGKSLHYIDFDCIHKSGNLFLEITKQVYRP